MTNANRLAALEGREFLPAARELRQLMQRIANRPPITVTVLQPAT